MVVVYAAVGLLAGSVTAGVVLLAGYSWGAAFAIYILAGNLGVAATAFAVALKRLARETQPTGWQDAPPAESEMAQARSWVTERGQDLKAAPPVASQSLMSLHRSQGRQTIEHQHLTSSRR